MGTTHENVQEQNGSSVLPGAPAPATRPSSHLPPKGSCWYCEKSLDSVRRFCGKDCHEAFDEEQEFNAEGAGPPA